MAESLARPDSAEGLRALEVCLVARKWERREAAKQEYVELLLHPGWMSEPKVKLAAALGVSRKTLDRYDKELDWEWIREERRKRYAGEIVQIDASLLRKAKSGDVPAVKLAYERFDGYVPAQALTLQDKTDAELLEIADKLKAEREKGQKAEKGEKGGKA